MTMRPLRLTRKTIRLGSWACYVGMEEIGVGTWGVVSAIGKRYATLTIHGMNGRGRLADEMEAPITDLSEIDDPEPMPGSPI